MTAHEPSDPRKVGGWAGIMATVLMVASMFSIPAPPGMKASAEEIRDYLLDNRGGANASVLLTAVALPLLLFFLTALRAQLASSGDSWLSDLATRCGAYFGLALAIGNAAFYSAVWTRETGDSPAAVFRVTWDLAYLVYLSLFPLLAVLLIGTGVVALRSKLLAAWWAWLGVVVGIAVLLGTVAIISYTTASVSFPVYLGFLIWLLCGSILLVRASSGTDDVAGATAGDQES